MDFPSVSTGPGRIATLALPVGGSSVHEHGTQTTAFSPATVDMSDDLHDLDFNFAFATTLTFGNGGEACDGRRRATWHCPSGSAR